MTAAGDAHSRREPPGEGTARGAGLLPRALGMAFMEKLPAGKVLLDDTVPLTAVIEASQSLHSHTVSQASGTAGPRLGCGKSAAAAGGRGEPWKNL